MMFMFAWVLLQKREPDSQKIPLIGVVLTPILFFYLFVKLPFWINKAVFFKLWQTETFGDLITYIANIPVVYDVAVWLDAVVL